MLIFLYQRAEKEEGAGTEELRNTYTRKKHFNEFIKFDMISNYRYDIKLSLSEDSS